MARPSSRVLGGAALVVASCAAVQGSAALSSSLFEELPPPAVAGWRQMFGALLLVAFMRPRLRGRTKDDWRIIVILGAAIAMMNASFYLAVDLMPLGIAATLLYLGPFAVAALHTEVGWRLTLPALALVGVALVSRPSGGAGALGICVGLAAAAALAGYTVGSQRLGRDGGLDGLALAISVSALILSPFSAASVDEVQLSQWLILVASGVIGVGVAFSCDFVALKLAGTRIVATLFALDPVLGALIGAAALSQQQPARTLVGIAVIVFAGALTTAMRDSAPVVSRYREERGQWVRGLGDGVDRPTG
jgi:inner membrane transporter RhtA